MYVDTSDMATIYDMSESTWNKWRVKGCWPPYIKLGRAIRYETDVVDKWMAERQRRSTSEPSRTAEAERYARPPAQPPRPAEAGPVEEGLMPGRSGYYADLDRNDGPAPPLLEAIKSGSSVKAMTLEIAQDLLLRTAESLNAPELPNILPPGRQSVFCLSAPLVRELVIAWKAMRVG